MFHPNQAKWLIIFLHICVYWPFTNCTRPRVLHLFKRGVKGDGIPSIGKVHFSLRSVCICLPPMCFSGTYENKTSLTLTAVAGQGSQGV